MEGTSFTRSDIVGLSVQRVLQSPWTIDRTDPNEPNYCYFYLLLESGVLANIFELDLVRARESVSALIDTTEIDDSQRLDYINRRISAIAIDRDTSDLVVLFDSGCWLTPKISLMGHGTYLMSGQVGDLNSPDRREPLVDYWDGTELRPWVISSSA